MSGDGHGSTGSNGSVGSNGGVAGGGGGVPGGGDGGEVGHGDVGRARELVHGAQRVAVLTGAGISTESGIPDFRGPQGVWTKNPQAQRTATLQHYLRDPEVRKESWRNRLASPAFTAEPNAGHRAIVELERAGKLVGLITQNIDELHQRAGSSADLVIEVHGTMRRVRCWSCGEEAPMERALDRVRAGEEDPACRSCGGILKSATISFGQNLEPDVVAKAERAALACDLMLVVGSSLTVHPAAGLVPAAVSNGARLVIVNAEPTPYDRLADVVVRGQVGTVLPVIVTPLR